MYNNHFYCFKNENYVQSRFFENNSPNKLRITAFNNLSNQKNNTVTNVFTKICVNFYE